MPLLFHCALDHHKQSTMKVLFTLIALALLTGCSSLTVALHSVEEFYSDLSKGKVNEMTSVDKVKASKPQSSPTVPAPSTADHAKTTSTKSATSTVSPPASVVPVPFAPSKILEVGSHGEEVLALQNRLNELRYEVGANDGFYGQQTWQGVVAFQKYANLKAHRHLYAGSTESFIHGCTS